MPETIKQESQPEENDALQQEIDLNMKRSYEKFRLYKEALESGDPEMMVSFYMRAAKNFMEEEWGIKDLRVKEGDKLRGIIRSLLPQMEEEEKLLPLVGCLLIQPIIRLLKDMLQAHLFFFQ